MKIHFINYLFTFFLFIACEQNQDVKFESYLPEDNKPLIDSFFKENNLKGLNQFNNVKVKSFQTIVELYNQFPLEPELLIGVNYLFRNLKEECFESIDSYIKTNPNKPMGYYLKGLSTRVLDTQDFDAAYLYLRKAAYMDTTNLMYRDDLSMHYAYDSIYDSVVFHTNYLIKRNPNNEATYFLRANALIELSDYENGLKDLNRITGNKIKRGNGYYELKVKAYIKLNQKILALEAIDSLLKMSPKEPEYYNIKGKLLSNLKRYKETYYTLKMGAELGCLECDTSLKHFEDYK